MKRIAAILFVIIFGIVVLGIWWTVSLAPINPQDPSEKSFIIARGDGVREIAKKLHDQGLVKDQVAFFLLVKKLGLEKNIQAGNYRLSPSLSAQELAQKLTVGIEDTRVTIPEGWRTEQIIDHLREKNFAEGTRLSDEQVDLRGGRYFPDTYLIPKESSIDQILDLMLQNFSKKVTFPITQEQLIVASLVEREAKHDVDRPIVAGIIHNRLKEGMALGVDATLQYAIGYTEKDGWWKKELTSTDKKFISPYNTYTNPGLPPTAICNPGLSSIKAAVNPAKTDYYYYISDKSGVNHYARTLGEHNSNVAKYLR